jgi:hypothetical protein
MAKNLTDLDISNIVSLIEGWDSGCRLTWERLCKLAFKRHSITITRQAIHKYLRIKVAFTDKKRGTDGKTPYRQRY